MLGSRLLPKRARWPNDKHEIASALEAETGTVAGGNLADGRLYADHAVAVDRCQHDLTRPAAGVLPEDEQNIVRAKVKSIIESDLLLSDRDTIEFPYVTELHLFGKQD